MPNDESIPSLARLQGALPPGIKLPDPVQARAYAAGSPGGVPPMFRIHTPSRPDAREPERLSD